MMMPLPDGWRIHTARLYHPPETAAEISFHQTSDSVEFTIPHIDIYVLASPTRNQAA